MSSAKSQLGLPDSIVRSAERLYEVELYCLGHRRNVTTALGLLNKIYHRVDHPMNEYLSHFIAARNTTASAALGELASLIPRWRTDQFSGRFCLLLFVCETCCRRAC